MKWTNACQGWRRRSSVERRLLLEALAALAIGRASIRLFLFQRVAARLGLALESAPVPVGLHNRSVAQLPPEQARLAIQIGQAVRTAAARIPGRATCLVQALAGAGMLRRRNIPCILSLGVAKNSAQDTNHDGDRISAHAWLDCGGTTLTGAAGHDRFTTISAFVAPQSGYGARIRA